MGRGGGATATAAKPAIQICCWKLEFYYHFVVLKYMHLGVEGCDTRVRSALGVIINGPRGGHSQLSNSLGVDQCQFPDQCQSKFMFFESI